MFELIAVGADPEVFFKEKNGLPRSAEGIVGGTKAEPRPIPGGREGFFVQEDNVAAEFNIPPASKPDDFVKNIARAMKYVEAIGKKNKLDLAVVSAMHFPIDQLVTPHAMLLGCEPDFNAWTGQMNPKPMPPPTLRTAAGHVHISYKMPNELSQRLLGKACDVFLGIPSLFVTEKNERRALYGKAGAMRFKKYGIEYRTLDNFWITEAKYARHIFTTVQKMMGLLAHNPSLLEEQLNDFSEEIQQVINEHDLDGAIQLAGAFNAPAFPA